MRARHLQYLKLIQSGARYLILYGFEVLQWVRVDGARVLSTIYVPRATSGQLGSGVFEVVHVDVKYTRVSVYLYPYHPFHGCAHYLVWSNPW